MMFYIIFACSNESNEQSNDPLIGEWIAYRGEEHISNSNWDVYDLYYTATFLADGTWTDSGGCSGLREKIDNNQFNYKLYYNCDKEEEPTEIIFFCNNNIIRHSDESTIGNVYGYMHKSNYNPYNCNEVTYFGN